MTNWCLRKKKKDIFCTVYFVGRNFFLTYVFYFNAQCIMYWTYFQIIHIFTYQKHYFVHYFVLFLKSSTAFSVSLIKSTLDKDFFIVKIDFWINRLEDSYVMMIQPFFDCSFSVWFPNLRKDSLIVCFVYNCRRRHGWEQLNLQKLTS